MAGVLGAGHIVLSVRTAGGTRTVRRLAGLLGGSNTVSYQRAFVGSI